MTEEADGRLTNRRRNAKYAHMMVAGWLDRCHEELSSQVSKGVKLLIAGVYETKLLELVFASLAFRILTSTLTCTFELQKVA